ncbi:MBL fold metallo-hydrolase [Paenibacillus sp. FSL K6-1566]|uniref:Glyoxylase-like metal-dependent hydrolase (Beta-lactamase superfamily II) n=1 Tax=Paenibacillus lactis TaxID=228574 RepID=A0ABS4FJB8_9BACL|nr:MBL fold metallo-hydrolase [Paenibacillus lactis]MBP1896350.1 glyoxylase-like metal-dependent hydrolase (beta-lactamase superfamily II) [Paenibacillus lactis]MCM3497415.1 MBL fold metallo-hydrolase [Paenibacillus lactis]HAG01013.1 MBL fold metallo-hydrolase [Paenibacillus lactis]
MNEHSMLNTGAVDTEEVLPDLINLRTMIVNLQMVGSPGSGDWVLVDTGIGNFEGSIAEAAEKRFGRPPVSIVLTHGHFDHVGNVKELADRWGVPVYAHELELPYLTGREDYPPGDPSVGGGLMARLAPMYPNRAIDLGSRIHPLPMDGTVPGLPEWRWIPTPGHSPGHISLFRERDRTLIAGDAIITVQQESALAVISQEKELHGPPMYFTPDWDAARESVRRLEALNPALAVTGHGVPMSGDELSVSLKRLARDFDELAVPEQGRYVEENQKQ